LLSAYGGSEGLYGEWVDDIPVIAEKDFQNLFGVRGQNRLTKWQREKDKNAVLDMGEFSAPDTLNQFIEFEIENKGNNTERFSIFLDSWIDLMSNIFQLVAFGIKSIHVCLYLIGYWRSGNLKGTRGVGEIHAQTSTSVKPVYYAALCLPNSGSSVDRAPHGLPPKMKEEDDSKDSKDSGFNPDRCSLNHPRAYTRAEMIDLCQSKGMKGAISRWKDETLRKKLLENNAPTPTNVAQKSNSKREKLEDEFKTISARITDAFRTQNQVLIRQLMQQRQTIQDELNKLN
jgi:hypothetical protein